jgi:hypothetical protein
MISVNGASRMVEPAMNNFLLAAALSVAFVAPAMASEEPTCTVQNVGHEVVDPHVVQFRGEELVAHVLPNTNSKSWMTFKIGSEVYLTATQGRWGFVYGIKEGTENPAAGGYLFTGAGWVELSGLHCHQTSQRGTALATEHENSSKQECNGILITNHDGDLSFDIPPEGVCEINKSETGKVPAQCTPGHFCRVYGVVEDCKDSGECWELTKVLQVTRTK